MAPHLVSPAPPRPPLPCRYQAVTGFAQDSAACKQHCRIAALTRNSEQAVTCKSQTADSGQEYTQAVTGSLHTHRQPHRVGKPQCRAYARRSQRQREGVDVSAVPGVQHHVLLGSHTLPDCHHLAALQASVQ